MDIAQIECVLAVAKHHSFTEAAYDVALSQSAVSKNISGLELELNVRLFERNTRSVELTPAGEEFVKYGAQMLESYQSLRKSLQKYKNTDKQHLIIGSIIFGDNSGITSQIAAFAKAFPEIKFEIVEGTTVPLVDGVLDSSVDVAFVSSMYPSHSEDATANYSLDKRLISYSIAKDDYYLVTSKNHPLANRESVDYDELKDEKFLIFDKSMSVYYNAFYKLFEKEGYRPNIILQCSSIRTMLGLIAENTGVALLSSRVAKGNENIVLIPLSRPLVRDTQIIIRNDKNLPVQVKAFFNFFKNNR